TVAAPDTTAPAVISVTPGDGAMGIGLNAQVVVTFSESVNPSTVNNNTIALFANGGRFGNIAGVSADNLTVVLNGGMLPASSVVTVALTSAIQDLSGNRLADFTTAFTTAPPFDTARPSVVSQRPGNGASGVAAGTRIVLFLSEPLDATTVTATTVTMTGPAGAVNIAVTLDATGQVIRLVPAGPLVANSYYFYQTTAAIRGINGLAPQNPGSWYFYTGGPLDATAPAVRSITPPPAAVSVGDNARIIVRFTEQVNPLTVNGTTLSVAANASVPTSVTFSNQNMDVYLEPYAPLPDGQSVTVAIAGVTDIAGNPVTATSAQFTVGAGPDVKPPTTLAENPVNGLTNVP